MEWDYFEIQSKKDLPTPSVLLGKGPQPDNRFHSQERPYKGPEDAIKRWLDEGEKVIAEVEKLERPYQTRGGRQPKPRRLYSHQDEQIRENELRAQAKAEALRKLEAKAKRGDDKEPPVTSTATKDSTKGGHDRPAFFKGPDENISPIKKVGKTELKDQTDKILEEVSKDRASTDKANEELKTKVSRARASLQQLSEASASPTLRSKSNKTDNTEKDEGTPSKD
jgi:hypothetical protein